MVRLLRLQLPTKNKVRLHCSYVWLYFLSVILTAYYLFLGQKTLHGHWLIWIKALNRLREMLFHAREDVSNAARERYKEYINKVMSSSFGEENLHVTHNCGNKKATQQETSDEVEIDEDLEHDQNKHDKSKLADDIFYDYIKDGPNAAEQLQCIRNTQSKHKKDTLGGKILTCLRCHVMFSTTEIVNMSLPHHKRVN